jgi:dTDP-glucose 4,6-dehydratase
MDFSKIKNELGWTPQQTLENGLRKTVNWYIENRSWIEDVTGASVFEDWIIKNYQSR